jgi:hypothetical protein
MRFVGLAFLAGRGALLVVVALSRAWIPERSPNAEKDFVAFPDHPLWDSFFRWDSGWYDRIARLGYFRGAGQSDVAFFPAFPYLSRWLGPLFGGHFAAGLVIGNAGLLAGLYLLHEMAVRHVGEDGARRAVWLVLVYPATVFYSAYYTEGLFLLAVTGSFYFYERDRLLPAGLFGGLAAMTRGAGVLLFPALLVGVLARGGWRLRGLSPRALWLGLILVGLAVVLLTLEAEVGDPLAFMKVQASWGRASSSPVGTILREMARFDPGDLLDWLDLSATLGLVVVAAVAWKKLDPAHAVFALLCVVLPLCSGRTRSMERYAASVPAVFLVLALATRRPAVARAVFVGLAGLMVVQTGMFVRWYWAG